MQTEAVRVAASCCRQSPRIAKRQSKSSRPDGHQLTARRRLALLVGGVKGVQLTKRLAVGDHSHCDLGN